MFQEGFTLTITPRELKRRLRNIEHKLKVQRRKLDFLKRSTPEQCAKMPWLKCECVVRKHIASLQERAQEEDSVTGNGSEKGQDWRRQV